MILHVLGEAEATNAGIILQKPTTPRFAKKGMLTEAVLEPQVVRRDAWKSLRCSFVPETPVPK